MNILILTEKLEVSSGWGRYSIDLVESLQKNGHRVIVACARENDGLPNIPQICILPSPLQFKKTHVLFPWYARVLRSRLRNFSFVPDIIHCVVEPYAPIAASLGAALQAPHLVTCHGSFAVNMFGRTGVGMMQKRALLSAAAVVCVSDYTRRQLLMYAPKLSPYVIHNGINIGHFVPAGERRHQDSLMLSVGALKARKGFDRVIAALPEVCRAVPNVRYTIIGNQSDTSYYTYLVGLVHNEGLKDCVQFLEDVPDELLHSYYARAKVFVLTPVSTLTNFEGFGLVYLEAGAYGVPAVGSYGNGGEEAIIEGRSGFLAHADDTHEVANQIIKVLTMDAHEYDELSLGARERAHELSWDNVIRKYLKVYEAVLLKRER